MVTATETTITAADQEEFFARIFRIVSIDDSGGRDDEEIRQERIAIMIYEGGVSEGKAISHVKSNEMQRNEML